MSPKHPGPRGSSPEHRAPDRAGRDGDARERAVALRYHETEELPRVVASGAGEVARRILEIAVEHGVPIYEDGALASLLSSLKPGATISEESYAIVAEIISFLYHTDAEWRASRPHLTGPAAK